MTTTQHYSQLEYIYSMQLGSYQFNGNQLTTITKLEQDEPADALISNKGTISSKPWS
jgi:hypothetical protein